MSLIAAPVASFRQWLFAPHRVRADGLREFLWFGLKEALSCVFAGGFFAILLVSKLLPSGPLPRYDLILIGALLLQAAMLRLRLETRDELKAICLIVADLKHVKARRMAKTDPRCS
jgi:uncharacterized membrane protein YoaT (DUF817 family)